jgi:antiviral helicase SKI2
MGGECAILHRSSIHCRSIHQLCFPCTVNMPARSVVFNSVRKHDGVQFRELQPGEYTQMAGRAGRRGLDKVGTVILCCFGDTPPPQTLLRNMLTGSSTKLQSQFRLTYTMILNLLRVEDMSVEGMIKRSFSEFATQRALTTNEYPKLLARGTKTLLKLDEEFKHNADGRVGCEDVEEYYFACRNVLSSNKKLLSYILGSGGTGGGALVAGRILLVTSGRKQKYVCTPALVLRPPDSSSQSSNASGNDDLVCICMVLLPQSYTHSSDSADRNEVKFGALDHVGEAQSRSFAIHKVRMAEIFLVSAVKYKIDSKVFYKEDASKNAREFSAFGNPFAGTKTMKDRHVVRNDDNPFAGMKARGKMGKNSSQSQGAGLSQEAQLVDDAMSYLINAEKAESDSGLSLLDLRECAKNMHQVNSAIEFGSAYDRLEHDVAFARQFRSHYHPSLETHYITVDRRETLRSRVKVLRHMLSNESLQLFPDFEMRKAMLQSLGYVDENDTVCLKGRVACEVNTCEGLIVTEMVFGGMLNELEPPEIVAALSALLFQEKTDDDIGSDLPERLISSCERMKAIAVDLGQRQKDVGLPVDPLEYCANSLKMGLVHVVYEWACGVPFSSICELTDVQEGSIVRCITRLDELCREVRNCARVVGNPTLYRKMEAASEAIKRDIVFASSLYVS